MRKVLCGVLIVIFIIGIKNTLAQEIPRTLFVLNGLGRTVSKMNLETQEVTNNILTVGDIPNRILAHGDKIYVVNSTPPGITIIDGRTDTVFKQISLTEGSNPWSMEFVGINKAYVTNLLANSVTVLNLATGDSLNTISVGENPEGILVVNKTAYVANTGGFPDYSPSTVSVIDIETETVVKTLPVATNPQELALAPDGNIHVVCTGNFATIGGKVYIINPVGSPDFTPTVMDSVIIGGIPADIIITHDGIAYLADFGDANNGFIYSYNATTKDILHNASNPILVGRGAMNLLYDAISEELYVNNFSDDAVQQLDPSNGEVIQTFLFGDGAQDMAILELERPTSVVDRISSRPTKFTLFQNYPNPFNPETTIEFSVPSKLQVQIRIYNLKGQLIRTLIDQTLEQGLYSTIWDGKNDRGQNVASSIYFYEMKAGNFRASKRLTLLK